ncbi:MAG TPA: DUF3619 family protein [Azospira sp.]|nr:DUF3619 family protein [Azospira sp.]
MNERDFANQVRQHLDRSLQDIDTDKLDRLRRARERALAAQRQTVTAPSLAGIGHALRVHLDARRPRQFFVALALLLAAMIYAQWHAETLIADLSDVDSALLADEMPVEAFTDQGFESWLKDSL